MKFEGKNMSIKQRFSEILRSSSALGNINKWLRNHLNLHGNHCDMLNIHCSKNQIAMPGSSQTIYCHASSYLRETKIHMEGDRNALEIAENSCIYGEGVKTVYVCGNNNHIVIGEGCTLRKISFFIRGSGNTIVIGDNCSLYNAQFHMEQNDNEIRIGDGTTLHGREYQPIHMAVDEGSKILIGEDCMLAHSIQFRSTDSHSIVDLSGRRLNPAKDILIGNHCWIGLQCIILKGTEVAEHSVIAAGAVCSKKYLEPHCIIAGNPAKIVKQNIDWDRKFL